MKTIKVRIPVAVRADGEFNAVAYSGTEDSENRSSALEFLEQNGMAEHVVWLEAEIPLPEDAKAGVEVREPKEVKP